MSSRIDVVAAVIVRDGRVLCTQRGVGSLAGFWEFPGGKVEQGEEPHAALRREIFEELRCEIRVGEEITTSTHEDESGSIALTTFLAELVAGEPRLTEHVDARWLCPADLGALAWAPADLPTVRLLRDHNHGR